jgi:hypothetical protein
MVEEAMPIVALEERWIGLLVGEHGALVLDPSLALPQVYRPLEVV